MQRLSPEELLAVIKILFGSRVLDQKTLDRLIKKLINCANVDEKELFRKICKSEMEFYQQPEDQNSGELIKRVWELEQLLRQTKEISITYKRLDGEIEEKTLYPIAITCDGRYFYFLACEAGQKASTIRHYRIDRICSLSFNHPKGS